MPELNLTGGRRRILWDKPARKEENTQSGETQSYQTEAVQTTVVQPKPVPEQRPEGLPTVRTTRIRNGNGHASTKKRKLSDYERDAFRERFMELGGCLADKDKECTALHERLNQESLAANRDIISVWQVTGFISAIHRDVAARRLILPDMSRYLGWMRNKYGLWAQYHSPRYEAYRRRAEQEEAARATAQSGQTQQVIRSASGFPRGQSGGL